MKTVRVDLVSDVVCPWCVVGYKRLQKALEQIAEQVTAEIHWHPFELNPNMGEDGQDLREHIMEKYGSSVQESDAARANLTTIGEQVGFRFNFSDNSRMYNTRKAHQLLMWATPFGKQQDLELKLFDAYFTQQQNISDPKVLIALAASIGLDQQLAAQVIDDPEWAEKVKVAEQYWLKAGIQGVPAFVINQQHLISGAQEPDTLANALLELAL